MKYIFKVKTYKGNHAAILLIVILSIFSIGFNLSSKGGVTLEISVGVLKWNLGVCFTQFDNWLP